MIGTREMGFTRLLHLFKSAFIQGFISAFTFSCSVSQPFQLLQCCLRWALRVVL